MAQKAIYTLNTSCILCVDGTETYLYFKHLMCTMGFINFPEYQFSWLSG